MTGAVSVVVMDMAGVERNRAALGQTQPVSWRDVDDDEWDGELGPDEDDLGPRRLPPAVVAVAWLVVIAMLGSAVAAFVVLLFG